MSRPSDDLPSVEIPDAFVTSNVAREGLAGKAWTAAHPGRIREPCHRLDLVVVGPTLLSCVAVDLERPGWLMDVLSGNDTGRSP